MQGAIDSLIISLRVGGGIEATVERSQGSRVMTFFSLVKEEYNQVFCIQNVVQYFGMGHWCVRDLV